MGGSSGGLLPLSVAVVVKAVFGVFLLNSRLLSKQ